MAAVPVWELWEPAVDGEKQKPAEQPSVLAAICAKAGQATRHA
jgi:hypothetical protein